ncbi:NAD(P)-binding protein [Heliocybe sulcata]|uniref:NAD(P)-binding protein n=1 Tax=Heliocybe sulcata TaxID=5364 RepID=A0A5C3NJ11_9AGAM|nr:NAD(P)-binding protein [Heliocybe sulcata]
MPGIADSKCILVIGATAGIGRALALSLLALPSKPTVIVSGRRRSRLDELAKEGLEVVHCDVDADRDTLDKFVSIVLDKYPQLDSVVFSAGIQHEFDFTHPETVDLDAFTSEINTNYIAIVTMIKYFLPHLLRKGSKGQPCFIIPVSSQLGILPAPWVPCYAATKAALHSYTISLEAQMRGTNVNVIEIAPPLVESELHDHQGKSPSLSKMWMPLDKFTEHIMKGLLRGDSFITAGSGEKFFSRFEEGKAEAAYDSYQRMKGVWAEAK